MSSPAGVKEVAATKSNTPSKNPDGKSIASSFGNPKESTYTNIPYDAGFEFNEAKEEDKYSKGKKIIYFIYNPKNGFVLGRSGMSWLRVGIFYIFFYFFIFSFFTLNLVILIDRVGEGKPVMTGNEKPRILSLSQGLTLYPSMDYKDKTISYDMSNSEDIENFSMQILNAIQDMNEYQVSSPNCNSVNNYGYKDGKPCVIIRFNKIFGWVPESMENLEQYLKDNYGEDETHRKSFTEYQEFLTKKGIDFDELKNENVGVYCYGSEGLEAENITIYPKPGIPVEPFKTAADDTDKKEKTVKWSWTPYIIVQFEPELNKKIEVVCRAYEKHMDLYYGRYGIGTLRFNLEVKQN